MELLALFGKNFGLSFAGLALYGLFLYGRNLNDNKRDPRIFFKRNLHFGIWALLVQAIYSFIMALFPVLEKAVANWLIGIVKAAIPAMDFEIPEGYGVIVVYLLGGWLLSLWVKKNTKTKSNGR